MESKRSNNNAPTATPDGRLYVRFSGADVPDDSAFWVPLAPLAGDPVYCAGVVVGEVGGDLSRAGEGYITTNTHNQLPPALAERLKNLKRPANLPTG